MATAEAFSSSIEPLRLLPPAPDFHARFSREAYHRLFEIGVLDRASHVELIDGEIFMMLPMGPPQGSYIGRLNDFFVRHLPDNLYCRVQMPIIAGDHSEPEPDIAIVARREDYYKNRHPSPADVSLLIEVSHSSLSFDLGRKLKLYASSNIPEYWVVDVERSLLHIHRAPTGNLYSDAETLKIGDEAAPRSAPECHIAVDWLFR